MAAHGHALGELAHAKLAKILGPRRGEQVFAETLAALGVADLESADDLYAFSMQLTAKGGIEGAVGALLGVAAVVRGAAGRDESKLPRKQSDRSS